MPSLPSGGQFKSDDAEQGHEPGKLRFTGEVNCMIIRLSYALFD
jgi:hypothetical protein